MIKSYKNDKINILGAYASFFIIVSALPFLTLVITVLGNLSDGLVIKLQNLILSLVPESFFGIVEYVIGEVGGSYHFSIISISALGAIWASFKGIGGLCGGIGQIFGCGTSRFGRLRAIGQTFIFLFVIIGSLFIFSFSELIITMSENKLLILKPFIKIVLLMRPIIFFAILCAFFSILYYRLSGKIGKISHHFLGACFSSVGLVAFTYFYSLYISYALKKSHLYAGFGTLIFFIFWIYFCVIIILLGAIVNKYLISIDFFYKKRYNYLNYNYGEIMSMKRMVTIQDISCFGKCSITVALPLVSSMGIECSIIPTAVLSTHTGGFTGFTFTDLTEDIPKISEHWKKYDIKFDTIYTGYLGSKKQIDYVIDFIKNFKSASTLAFVDPAMADNGKLYTGFDSEFPKEMARLSAIADIIVPNITEACFMTDMEYKEQYDESYIKELISRLCTLGAKKVVITGVSYDKSKRGAVLYDSCDGTYYEYFRENIPMNFHGTGDTFASVLAGAMTKGYDMKKSLEIAVDFTVMTIKQTLPDAKEHFYGTKFEECIPYLLELMKK